MNTKRIKPTVGTLQEKQSSAREVGTSSTCCKVPKEQLSKIMIDIFQSSKQRSMV